MGNHDDADARMRRMRKTPPPPNVSVAPGETFAQALQSLVWSFRRRANRYALSLSLLLAECIAIAIVFFWGRPWWLLVIIVLSLFLVALTIGFWIRHISPSRQTYASENARLAISRHNRGWYVIDHVARPGTKMEGRRLRRSVAGELTTAADEQQVIVFAHTTSMELARAYMDDIPGLRIASIRGKKLLLVRVPRRHITANVDGAGYV